MKSPARTTIGEQTERDIGSGLLARSRARAALIPDLLVEAKRVANNVYADLRITNSVFAGNRFNAVDGGDGSTFTDNVFSDNGGFGIICYPTASSICALGRNAFQGNNGGGAAAQWSIHIVRDMVGNVCLDDGNCP